MSDMGDDFREQREYNKKQKFKYDQGFWREERREVDRLSSLGYEVVEKNHQYQIRINGILDIYPYNSRYHDLKKNERGDYKDMVKFVNWFIKGLGDPTI